MRRTILSLALLLSTLAPPARAQDAPATAIVQAHAEAVSVAAGGRAEVRVALTVAPPYHINANPPALDYLIPTEVSLTAAHGVRAGRARYPAGKSMKFSFEDQPLLVYDGVTTVVLPVAADAAATPGVYTLTGEVAYQACDDQVCLPPARAPYTVQVTIAAADPAAPVAAEPLDTLAVPETASDTAAAAGDGFMTAPPDDATQVAGSRLSQALESGGLGWLLALFVGGLLLNLTPCVFPMLGVTVSIFGARRAEPLPKVLLAAALYVLGIAAMYTALGVVAALTGGLFGAALQSVWVNVGLGLLLMVLSLGMFGLFEMQAPTWVLDRLGGANTANLAGVFLAGLGVGIIAAPCVGPFIVAILALIAQKQSVAFGVQSMFTIALGLGFPYLFLAAFSNLLQALPRQGAWMVWVKKVFGVIMATIGLSYVAIGLLPALAPYVVPAGLLLGGLYLGFMEKSDNARAAFRMAKRVLGTVSVLAAVALIIQTTRAKSNAIVFTPYDEAAVAASLAAGRPVLLEFSADWCVPCHEMELQTFVAPEVVQAARAFDTYKVDLTKFDSEASRAARERYAVPGVPAVVFLAPSGEEVRGARVVGFMGPGPFAERLAQASGR